MKKYSVIFLLVMSMLLFVSCSQTASTDQNVIKVGINYELSGKVATYGQSSVEGIELAIEQINQAGGVKGKKIQLVKYDNKSDASEATTLATRLMTQDKVVAVLGPATSGAFMATIPVANQNKVPVISGSATADNVTVDEKGVKEYAFRICFTDSQQGKAAGTFALETLSAKKAVIIMDSSSDYAKGLAEAFTSTFEAGGGTIVTQEAYMEGDTDFNAILTSIKDKDFDVIYIPGYYNEAGLIIKQARAQGIDVPVVGADGFDSPKLAELAGAEALNDVYFTNHYSSVDSSSLVADFVEAYKAKYNKEPDAFSALGYDLGRFVVDALSRAENIDGESLKKAIEATENFEGVTGNMSVDENHNVVKDIIVIELKDGQQYKTYRVTE